jgi:hypothetical protein
VEPRFLDEGPLARLLGQLYGAAVEPRFAAGLPPLRPGRPSPRARAAAAAESTPPPELMTETGFAALYERGAAGAGASSPRPQRASAAPEAAGAAPEARAVRDTVALARGAGAQVRRARLDPARLRPLASLDEARSALAAAGDAEQVAWLLARVALGARADELAAFAAEAIAALARVAADARQASVDSTRPPSGVSRRTPGTGTGR